MQLLLNGVVDYLPNPTQVTNEAHDQSNNEAKVILESRPDKPFVTCIGPAVAVHQDRTKALDAVRPHAARALFNPLLPLSPADGYARDGGVA